MAEWIWAVGGLLADIKDQLSQQGVASDLTAADACCLLPCVVVCPTLRLITDHHSAADSLVNAALHPTSMCRMLMDQLPAGQCRVVTSKVDWPQRMGRNQHPCLLQVTHEW